LTRGQRRKVSDSNNARLHASLPIRNGARPLREGTGPPRVRTILANSYWKTPVAYQTLPLVCMSTP
jgi:hypothetical protein